MVIEIKKPITRKKVGEALARSAGSRKKKNLRKHFGKLKRGLDGMAYQKEVRDAWN